MQRRKGPDDDASVRRPTAADVAELAGVSRSTVSYILNGSALQTFTPATVQRVRAAAAGLSYAPQPAARALRRGTSDVVLLPLPDLPSSANFSRLLSALTDGVRATGRSLAIVHLRPGDRVVDVLGDVSAAALLEVLPLADDDRAAVRAAGVPLLSVAHATAALDRQAGALQVRHLAALGHTRLGVVTATERSTLVFARPRLAGITEAAAVAGMAPPEVEELAGPPERALAGLGARLHRWRDEERPVTAVCCFNDLFAATVVSAATAAGLRVPDDLAVVGVDDELLAGMLSPTLTTVRFDYAGVAARVGHELRHRLDGGPPPGDGPAGAADLVVRRSSARP